MSIKILLSATLLGLQILPAWAAGSPAELHLRQASSSQTSTTNARSLIISSSTQVPIATVCPPGMTPSARFAGNTLATLPAAVLDDIAESVIIIASATLPGGVTTTFSKLAKKSADSEDVANIGDPARLVIGTDGCQTLYAPTTTANCSTVVTPGAMPPVTVTDCDQYVTFSSETLFSCAPTPTFTPLTAGSSASSTRTLAPTTSRPFSSMTTAMGAAMMPAGHVRPNILTFSGAAGVPMSLPRRMLDLQQDSIVEKRQLLMYPGLSMPILTELVTVAPTYAGSLSFSFPSISFPPILTAIRPIPESDAIVPRDADATDLNTDFNISEQSNLTDGQDAAPLAQLSPPSPTKYYAAPWYEIAAGGVPTQVQAVVCSGGLAPSSPSDTPQPDTDGDTEDGECLTYNEAWSVTTVTRTRMGTKIASFDGPAVLTFGSSTRTTFIHFTQTITTTKTLTYPSVAHTTLGILTRPIEPTVTQVRTNPAYTQTISLISLQSTSLSEASASFSDSASLQEKVTAAAAAPESGASLANTPQPLPASTSYITPSVTTSNVIGTGMTTVNQPIAVETTSYAISSSVIAPFPFESSSLASNLNESVDGKVNVNIYLNRQLDISSTAMRDDFPTTVTEHLTVATQTVTVSSDGYEIRLGETRHRRG